MSLGNNKSKLLINVIIFLINKFENNKKVIFCSLPVSNWHSEELDFKSNVSTIPPRELFLDSQKILNILTWVEFFLSNISF